MDVTESQVPMHVPIENGRGVGAMGQGQVGMESRSEVWNKAKMDGIRLEQS
jgi:hypothetical protein